MRPCSWIPASLLSLVFCLSLSAAAQTNGVDMNSQAERPTPSANSEQPLRRMDVKTFTGKVTRHSNGYVLYEMATGLVYKLDNQSEAKRFMGKDVSVVGQLVPPGEAIHVNKIERAK
ncbi:MAG TPA: DUF5818 domain-containing protein [Terriglobales bacterium]|nr:DUF5818 domain-containing protein [Terriglobales bacterium]